MDEVLQKRLAAPATSAGSHPAERQKAASVLSALRALRCSAGLCRDVNVLDLTPGLGDQQTLFPQTFDVKLDSFPDLGFGLLVPGAKSSLGVPRNGNATWLGRMREQTMAPSVAMRNQPST
jgi:hypothetical protein